MATSRRPPGHRPLAQQQAHPHRHPQEYYRWQRPVSGRLPLNLPAPAPPAAALRKWWGEAAPEPSIKRVARSGRVPLSASLPTPVLPRTPCSAPGSVDSLAPPAHLTLRATACGCLSHRSHSGPILLRRQTPPAGDVLLPVHRASVRAKAEAGKPPIHPSPSTSDSSRSRPRHTIFLRQLPFPVSAKKNFPPPGQVADGIGHLSRRRRPLRPCRAAGTGGTA